MILYHKYYTPTIYIGKTIDLIQTMTRYPSSSHPIKVSKHLTISRSLSPPARWLNLSTPWLPTFHLDFSMTSRMSMARIHDPFKNTILYFKTRDTTAQMWSVLQIVPNVIKPIQYGTTIGQLTIVRATMIFVFHCAPRRINQMITLCHMTQTRAAIKNNSTGKELSWEWDYVDDCLFLAVEPPNSSKNILRRPALSAMLAS